MSDFNAVAPTSQGDTADNWLRKLPVDIDGLRRLKAVAAATPLPTVPLDNPRSIVGATLPQTPKTMAQTAAATPLPAQPTATEIAAARRAKATAFVARKSAADALLNLVDGTVFAADPAALVKACADKMRICRHKQAIGRRREGRAMGFGGYAADEEDQ